MISATTLDQYIRQLLNIDQFSDYCPNGLQVEGIKPIRKLITGVTASQALLNAAVDEKADAIVVHHGYFWKGEPAPLIGMKFRRVRTLIIHDIHLFAYHLPLDAHPVLGNNAQVCNVLTAVPVSRFGEQQIGIIAELAVPMSLTRFQTLAESVFQRTVFTAGPLEKQITKIAVCTGGGQSFFSDAIAQNVDLFLSGEISEHNVHMAVETGVNYMAAGHHATERFGIQALGMHLGSRFDLDVKFIDQDSGV